MKSKELREFLINLSELNNSFTHYSFVWNQFDLDYAKLTKDEPEELTQNKFQSNPYSEKHNIKLDKLEAEHEKTNKTLIEGIYLLTFSYYESYLKSINDFAIEIDEDIIKIDEKIQSEEDDYLIIDKVINRIKIDKEKISNDELLTLDYLRLRRNRITHRNSENISNSLNDFIKANGSQLNTYWTKKLRAGLQEIDFSSKSKITEINFDFVIDTINILRFIMEKIDTLVLEKLGVENIIDKKIIPQFLSIQGKKLNGLKEERIIRKFKSYCNSEYSIKSNDIYERKLLKMI